MSDYGPVNKLAKFPSPAGRGWREAPGEGRKSRQILRPSPGPLPEGEGKLSSFQFKALKRRRLSIPIVFALTFMAGCAARTTNKAVPTVGTLAELRNVRPDVQEVKVEQGLDQAMLNYRRFLDETPETAMTPEAMRRLADLQLEKQFGIRNGDTKPREMAAPQPAQAIASAPVGTLNPSVSTGLRESDQDFERRTTAQAGNLADTSPPDAIRAGADPAGPLEAIALYERLLTEY